MKRGKLRAKRIIFVRNMEIETKRIFLVGYMGAGKTTVGKALAKQMNLSFIDLDGYIERRYMKSVGDIFRESGETEFRIVEQKMLHEVSQFENVVISTGGGTPCYGDNMNRMCSSGKTVYLRVSVDELVNRLEVSKTTRPVLKGYKGNELREFVSKSLKSRESYYCMASILFDAEIMLTKTDIDNIVKSLKKVL